METVWVEASAGTGKTTFLISQIADYKPEEILFITFSNAAANELAERIDNQKVFITTLHALAFKIILMKFEQKQIAADSLRDAAILQMLENDECYQLICWLLEENVAIDESICDMPKPIELCTSLPTIVRQWEHEADLASNKMLSAHKINEIKLVFFTKSNERRKRVALQASNDYIEWAVERVLLHEKHHNEYTNWVLSRINYLIAAQEQKLKDADNLLYYNDLITLATSLLSQQENADLLYKFFGNIKLLLIDEAQDLANAQWQLVLTILSEWSMLDTKLIIASDKKQLIYDFQGASIEGFENSKRQIKKISKKFTIHELNQTYRLPKKVCDFVNSIGKTLNLEYNAHTTYREADGAVEPLIVDDISEIVGYIKEQNLENVMVLFKYKSTRMEQLAHAFFANGLLVDSPYSMMHPIIKDFQYLISWLNTDSVFAFEIIKNVLGVVDEICASDNENFFNKLKSKTNLEEICALWLLNDRVQEFLSNKLQKAKSFWENVLRQYSKFYKYQPYDAISDTGNFYKMYIDSMSRQTQIYSKKNLFVNGIKLNTIHSSKGMEAQYVFLCDTDIVARSKRAGEESSLESDRLLYVGLTRVKTKLMIVVLKQNMEHLDGTWAQKCLPALER